jgi:hypothetical protein
MENMKFLSPAPYSDVIVYFKDFFTENKANDKKFSFRVFAKQIGWPTSYLSDLIAGRKTLTLNRALQFAEFSKMKSLDQEHLIRMALRLGSATTNPIQMFDASRFQIDEKALMDVSWVAHILMWKRKKMTAVEIKSEFALMAVTLERIETALSELERIEAFEWDENGMMKSVKIPPQSLDWDSSEVSGDQNFKGLEQHRESAENFLYFIENPQGPALYNSRPIVIPRGKFNIIATKLMELRNWMDDFSQQHLEDMANPEESSDLLQLDINLFPVTKPKPQ